VKVGLWFHAKLRSFSMVAPAHVIATEWAGSPPALSHPDSHGQHDRSVVAVRVRAKAEASDADVVGQQAQAVPSYRHPLRKDRQRFPSYDHRRSHRSMAAMNVNGT
jgi:hypothetical protein